MPVWDQGPNNGRRFAIVRLDDKRHWYPFLRTDGTLHRQRGVMPHTALPPALEVHPAEKRGEGVVAVSSSESSTASNTEMDGMEIFERLTKATDYFGPSFE